MADAIDRKHHEIGPADQAGEQPAAILDAAIMMQEFRAQLFAERAQMAELGRAPADIEQRQAGEILRIDGGRRCRVGPEG